MNPPTAWFRRCRHLLRDSRISDHHPDLQRIQAGYSFSPVILQTPDQPDRSRLGGSDRNMPCVWGAPAYAKKCRLRNEADFQMIRSNRYRQVILAADWPSAHEAGKHLLAFIEAIISGGTAVTIVMRNTTIARASNCPLRRIMYGTVDDCQAPQQSRLSILRKSSRVTHRCASSTRTTPFAKRNRVARCLAMPFCTGTTAISTASAQG